MQHSATVPSGIARSSDPALGEPTSQKPVFGLVSSIGNQAREAFVHVILMMAMEERVARIVGHEVDFRGGKARQAYGVLDHAGC
jgi:hypothetical protein